MRFKLFVTLFILTAFSGCVNLQAPYLSMLNTNSNYMLDTDDFKIIGVVQAEGKQHFILGIIMMGGNGFEEIHAKAAALGGDDVIGYTFDVQQAGLFPFYVEYSWKARASVIKFTDNAVDKKLFFKERAEKQLQSSELSENSFDINELIDKADSKKYKKPLLFILTKWREARAKENNLPTSYICNMSELKLIADKQPRTVAELRRIKGVQLQTTDQYGKEIVKIIDDYHRAE